VDDGWITAQVPVVDDGSGIRSMTVRSRAGSGRIEVVLVAETGSGRLVEVRWDMSDGQAREFAAVLMSGGDIAPDGAQWLA